MDLIEALKNQHQVDHDGVFVGVSRQAVEKAITEIERLRAEVEKLRKDAERWLLIRLSNKTRVQVVRDGAWHTLFYGGHGNAEDAIDALRGEGEK